MSVLKELLALREARHNPTEDFKDLDLWQDGASGLESADVEVEYEYEGASYTDHPYGSTTAREHHGASCGIVAVRLKNDAKVYDDDGDKVIDTLKAGTDLMDQKWWKDSYSEWLADKICDGIDNQEPDFDEPDDYYDSRY